MLESRRALPLALPVSTRDVVGRGGVSTRTLHTFCPGRTRTVDLDDCIDCSSCAGFDDLVSSAQRPAVHCRFVAPARPLSERSVGTVLARFTTCVRRAALPCAPYGHAFGDAIAIVDEHLRFVGVLDPAHPALVDGAADLAMAEETPLASVFTQLARHRRRSAPVVARDGTVVGSVQHLDAIRAMRAGA